MYYKNLLKEALEVWCPNYPRQCSAKTKSQKGWGQVPANSADEIVDNLIEIKGKHPGYVSVYSFPEGHTSDSDKNVPRIDTLMFDLDFEGAKDASESEWRRDMTALLVRTRMVANTLLEANRDQYWRASLSGHKGIHLYLDFPALDRREGSDVQFRNGVEKYTNELLETIQSETGLTNLDEYVDVMSGKDFARLTRLPNTIHDKATARFGETRFCVPITIEELSKIRVDDYVRLTQSPRSLPGGSKRVESQHVHDVLVQDIRMAPQRAVINGISTSSEYDGDRLKNYKNQSNDGVTLKILKPTLRECCWRFHDRNDRFAHGQQSHIMELNCMAEMVAKQTPIDVMVEFFAVDENFSEEYTRRKIREVISYGYLPFKTKKLESAASVFF